MADEEKSAKEKEVAIETDETEADGKKKPAFPPLLILVYVGIVFAASALTELIIVPKVSAILASKGLVQEVVEETPLVPEHGEIYVIEDLVVNPAGSEGRRYVASIGLEASSTITAEIEQRDPQIKDALIQILSSHTIEQLADVSQREGVRAGIQSRVEEIVPQGNIDAVYFVSFVLQ